MATPGRAPSGGHAASGVCSITASKGPRAPGPFILPLKGATASRIDAIASRSLSSRGPDLRGQPRFARHGPVESGRLPSE
jgi:hypothetical protein